MSEKLNDIWRDRYVETLRSKFLFELKSLLGNLINVRLAQRFDKEYLHLGCGSNYLKDFVNADFYHNFKFWKKPDYIIDWQLDFRQKLRCENHTFRGVFTEHVIEHLSHLEAQNLFQELNRVMKKGGYIRIVVPDLEQCVEAYCLAKKNNIKIEQARLIWSLTQNWGHRSVWDFALMEEVLASSGFINIKKVEFGVGSDEKLLQDSSSRKVRSLYVEAMKS